MLAAPVYLRADAGGKRGGGGGEAEVDPVLLYACDSDKDLRDSEAEMTFILPSCSLVPTSSSHEAAVTVTFVLSMYLWVSDMAEVLQPFCFLWVSV